jgi:ribosomal protein S18 acetylase RimI-like enzyme
MIATPAVRRANADDAETLAALGARLFTEAYGPTHPEPELSRYLARAFAPASIASRLADPAVTYLVATAPDGAFCAYVHIDGDEIVRFYVDAPFQGSGLAQRLMTVALAVIAAAGFPEARVQVWQQAPQAIAFYRKCGFRVIGTAQFHFGERVDLDWMMARPAGS